MPEQFSMKTPLLFAENYFHFVKLANKGKQKIPLKWYRGRDLIPA